MKQKYIQQTLYYFQKYSNISLLCNILCTNHTYQPTPMATPVACHTCQSHIPLQYYTSTKLRVITWLSLLSLLGHRFHVKLVAWIQQQSDLNKQSCVRECVPVCVCVHACVRVCVSYRSKGVRDNSRRFTHRSKRKITTAAIGPFIS